MSSHGFYCSADSCNINVVDNIPFYRCPKDPERCQKWKDVMGFTGDHKYANYDPEEASRKIRICRIHFDEKSFTSSKKRLLKTAVPSALLANLDGKRILEQECNKQDAIPGSSIQQLNEVYFIPVPTAALAQNAKGQLPPQNSSREIIKKRKLAEVQSTIDTSQRHGEITLPVVLQFLDEQYSKEAAVLIKNQLLLLEKIPKGGSYSKDYKQLALSLFLLGPKAYIKLSKVIRLPYPATLKESIQHWRIYPGFNEFVFNILQLRVSSMTAKSKNCIICIDEMPLKSHLFYNISKDVIIGFEDMHNKKSNSIATSALVVMARGISRNWTQPISYFFSKNSIRVEDLKEILVESIRKLKSIGLKVLAVTSGQGPNFYKLVRRCFKLTFERPYFLIDNSPIFYLFDVPHLLKSTRKIFYSFIFCLDSGVVRKSYLEMMYNLDKTKQYRLAPKLTDEHINSNKFKNMEWNSQVFSHSVAVAMHTYIDFEILPAKAELTATFIDNMHKLFEILNSSEPTCQTFMGTTEQIDFLNKMQTLFSNLQVLDKTKKNVTKNLKFIYGWRLTISSVLNLWKVLRNKNYKSLATCNLNQDCFQNYFDQIRSACEHTRKPTAIQFTRAFQKLFVMKCFDENDCIGCLEDATDSLLAIKPDLAKKSEFIEEKKYENIMPRLKINTNDYKNLITEEGDAYVIGYFLRKCLLKHSCDICLDYCKSTILDELKVYEDSHRSFDDLPVIPTNFRDYLLCLENTFTSNFMNFCVQNGVGYIMMNEFSNVIFEHPCAKFPYEYMVCLYARVRTFYTLKFANKQIKSQICNKKKPKLEVLQNLYNA